MRNKIEEEGRSLNNAEYPLKKRFRALFALKNLGGEKAIDHIRECFKDKSALLKHELAYCLGQMRNPYAVPVLISVLDDETQEVVVRHEAAEALSSIGGKAAADKLKKYCDCSIAVIAETCQIGVDRLRYVDGGGNETANIYGSVDPAPPLDETNTKTLADILLNEDASLFERYRAMFALRDLGTHDSIQILNRGLDCGSVLFRHEIAFVLGQLQSPLSISALTRKVENYEEHDIVRHECVEALGSISRPECIETIEKFLHDKHDLVRESCLVALDICDYNNSEEQFQYASTVHIST